MAYPAASRMFGRDDEEIIAVGREGIMDASDPHLKEFMEERTRNGSAHGELRGLRPVGSAFPLEVSSKVFEDALHQLRTSIIDRYITVRKVAERQALGLRVERVRSRL